MTAPASAITDYLNLGGTIRSRTAEETIAFLKPLLKPLGITRVANVTGLDNIGIPVAVSIRPNSKHITTSQGKGITWELAYISAVMESIEGYHAENPAQPDLRGTYNDLSKHYPLVDVTLFNTGFFHITGIQNQVIDWIKGINLINNQPVYLPHAMMCLDTTKPHPEYGFFPVNTNGLAAGNSLDEAICHALYEIIERDALMRWAALTPAEREASQIQLESIESKLNQQLLNQLFQADNLVKIWDITSSIGIPAFQCMIHDNNALRRLNNFRGSGAHLSRDIALSRALTEAAQSRLTLISGSRDDIFLDHYHQPKSYTNARDTFQGVKRYNDCADKLLQQSSFAENKLMLLNQLSQQGFEYIYMFNHTKPDFNISVVHVLISGMQYNGRQL